MRSNNRSHFPIGKTPVHFTYRLHGSIPKGYEKEVKQWRFRKIEAAREASLKYPPGIGGRFLEAELFKINAFYEMQLDAYLHEDSNGPFHLSNPDVAKEILDSYRFLHDKQELFVYAVCVMSNHVHAVVRAPEGVDEADSGLFMSRHKSHTARMCNKLLERTGKSFWEDDYFDRTVRRGKFNTVMWYVLNNPVKAGLVNDWWEWPNTWLNPEYEELFKL
jgi:REP element-mobilizing transposase RayT